ncbi:MAG: hypothetical protein GWP19_10420 [Planctomycetia bacterium]|nr:hypothetical protein [Planctomycetia bacterium]
MMATTKERLSNKTTSPFFKKVRNWTGVIGVLALMVSKVPIIPEWIRSICEIFGSALIGGSGVAHLTTKNEK